MRFTYDRAYGLLYVYLDERGAIADQLEMADGSVLDVTADGSLVGVEVINLARWDPALVVNRFSLGAVETRELTALKRLYGQGHAPAQPQAALGTRNNEEIVPSWGSSVRRVWWS